MQRTHGGTPATPPTGAVPLMAVVDDDAGVCTSTCRLLRSFGFDAEAFESAEAFLDSDRAAQTACLILDVRMPGMDGLALQRHLAAHGPPIPIVFLTAHAGAAEERSAREAGAIAFFRKPVAAEELRRVLRSVVDVQ